MRRAGLVALAASIAVVAAGTLVLWNANRKPDVAATDTPSVVPTAQESIGRWPFSANADALGTPVFGPDGTAYLDVTTMVASGSEGRTAPEARMTAVDANGRQLAGWPVDLGRGMVVGTAAGDDGSATVLVCASLDAGASAPACVLHRLDRAGRETQGFPFVESVATDCGEPLLGADGTAYLVCSPGEAGGTNVRIDAIDRAGKMKAGWPVTLPSNDYSPTPKLGLDGTLYVLTDTSGGATKIHALGSDGKELPGWPADSGIPPNGQNRSLSYLVAADGTIRTWGYDNDTGGICVNAKHTVLNAIGTDGRVMPGWPRQVDGLGIEPVLDSQGTLYLAYGQPEGSSTRLRVTVVNEDGTTGSEWPASLEVVEGCPELQYRLALGPTGTIYVLGTAPTGDMVTAVDQSGNEIGGWPYLPATLNQSWSTPGSPPYAPLFGSDGTLYVAIGDKPGAAPTMVVALDGSGSAQALWEMPQPPAGDSVTVALTPGPGGSIYVSRLVESDSLDPTQSVLTIFVLGPDLQPRGG